MKKLAISKRINQVMKKYAKKKNGGNEKLTSEDNLPNV